MIFKEFSQNKNHYEKGQVFPFLVAVIAVFLVMAMITLNLGQLGIFKTEVSNAADAGALSGASVLSSTLLGLGLKSDMMSGRATEVIIPIIISACIPVLGWVIVIILAVAFFINMFIELLHAMGDSNMGWTNAKKTAVQYAFNNISVEEPQPTFESFLSNAYKTTPEKLTNDQLRIYYDEYMKGETGSAVRYARSGFSNFMQDIHNGYWRDSFGKVEPGDYSEAEVNSGYGWNDKSSGGGNSYSNGDSYKNYENWIEVQVTGAGTYAINFYSWIAEILNCLLNFITGNLSIPWYLEWLGFGFIIETTKAIVKGMTEFMPTGIDFAGLELKDRTKAQTDDNPLVVKVTRYKKPKDLGVWKLRYGEVSASGVGVAFREHTDLDDEETIRPQFNPGQLITNIFGCKGSDWSFFDTERHLFETKLTHAY
ncbi:MAG: Tad domain-containing protein [Candidatus Omnitrophica bacterium]|nr:Tad domain-containing protein [Candidatus Omnitrophota bacterium]